MALEVREPSEITLRCRPELRIYKVQNLRMIFAVAMDVALHNANIKPTFLLSL
jgi:hypothetical protein